MAIGWHWQAPLLSNFWLLAARSNDVTVLSKRVTHQIIANKLLKAWPWILTAPLSRKGESFEIIFPLNQKDAIDTILSSHRLDVVFGTPVTETQLQRCLMHSLYLRLAPEWNRAGTAVVHGKDFLIQGRNYQFFIDFSVHVCRDVLVRVHDSGMIRLRPVNLTTIFSNIRTDQNAMRRLLERLQEGNVDLPRPRRCFVLPTLKSALITSVTAKPAGVFDSFEKIATYWNSLYGYNIDSSLKEDMIYCNVNFFSETSYTYPSFCVCLDQGAFERRHNIVHILEAFYKDVDELLQIIGAQVIGPISTNCPILHWASGRTEERIMLCQGTPEFNLCSRSSETSITTDEAKNSIADVPPNTLKYSGTTSIANGISSRIKRPLSTVNGPMRADAVTPTVEIQSENKRNVPAKDNCSMSVSNRVSGGMTPKKQFESTISSFRESNDTNDAVNGDKDDGDEVSLVACKHNEASVHAQTTQALPLIAGQPRRVIRFTADKSRTKFVGLDNRGEFLRPQGIPPRAKKSVLP